jgi:hypothetical protein
MSQIHFIKDNNFKHMTKEDYDYFCMFVHLSERYNELSTLMDNMRYDDKTGAIYLENKYVIYGLIDGSFNCFDLHTQEIFQL